MATNFPSSLDTSTTLPYPAATNPTNSPSLSGLSDNQNDAIIAVETKLGTGSSTPSGTNLLVSTGAGTSAWTAPAPTGTIVGTSDSQTLTNKTLTSPTINTAVISNPTITADSINGFSVATNVTVGNVSLNNGAVGATTVTASGLVTASNGFTVSTGTITLPNGSVKSTALTDPHKFFAYLNVSGQTLASSAATKITLNATVYDTGSNFNTTNNRFTAPVAGFYHISVAIGHQISSTNIASVYIYKNSSVLMQNNGGHGASGVQIVSPGISATIQLAANDYLELWGANSNGAASGVTGNTYGTGATYTFMSGFLVSQT